MEQKVLMSGPLVEALSAPAPAPPAAAPAAPPGTPPAKRARATRVAPKSKKSQTSKPFHGLVPQAIGFHPCRIHCLTACDNMRWVLTGGEDGVIRKFDFFSSVNGKSPLPPILAGVSYVQVTKGAIMLSQWNTSPNPSPVTALHMDGDALWAMSGHRKGALKLWTLRVEEGRCQMLLEGHHGTVTDILPLREEGTLLTTGTDGVLLGWDLNKGQRTHALTAHLGPILTAAVHSDGQYVVSAGTDGMVKLWDLRTQRVQRSIRSTSSATGTAIHAVAWSSDGKACLCARSDGVVEEWDFLVPSATPRTQYSVMAPALCLRVLPNGRQVLIGANDGLYTFDLSVDTPSQAVAPHAGPVSHLLVDPTMQFVVTASGERPFTGYGPDNTMVFHTTLVP